MRTPRSLAVWTLVLFLISAILGPLSVVLFPLLIFTVPAGIAWVICFIVLIVQVLSLPPVVYPPALPPPPQQPPQQLAPGDDWYQPVLPPR